MKESPPYTVVSPPTSCIASPTLLSRYCALCRTRCGPAPGPGMALMAYLPASSLASLTKPILNGNRKILKGRANLAIGMDLAKRRAALRVAKKSHALCSRGELSVRYGPVTSVIFFRFELLLQRKITSLRTPWKTQRRFPITSNCTFFKRTSREPTCITP